MTDEHFSWTTRWPDYVSLGIIPLSIWIFSSIRRHLKKIRDLERTQVTRRDFDRLTVSLTQQITNNQLRTEDRFDEVNKRFDKLWEHLANSR